MEQEFLIFFIFIKAIVRDNKIKIHYNGIEVLLYTQSTQERERERGEGREGMREGSNMKREKSKSNHRSHFKY